MSTVLLTRPINSLHSRPQQVLIRQIWSNFVLGLTVVATGIAIGALLLVLGYLLWKGFGALSVHVLTRGPVPEGDIGGGLRNGIIGTLIMLGIASVIGIPIGVLGGIYQIEAKGQFAWIVRFFTDVLNGIPSVVIGVFIYIVVVLPEHHFSALAGGLALGILMIPTVMRTTEEILRLVPISLREASLGLGATRWRTMVSVILPAAQSGIITGIMLALARIAGETAPLLYTAFGNNQYNTKLDKPVDALPLNIFNYATSPYASDNKLALAGAIILISLIFILSLLTRLTTGRTFTEEK
jgi:phosphate transport system permease protein